MVAQDIGGAIRGPVRGDMFFGFGAEAERRAGAMKAPGRLYVLLPAGLADKLGNGRTYPP
jgi:membrane-bound lytic murein transglycosylase A